MSDLLLLPGRILLLLLAAVSIIGLPWVIRFLDLWIVQRYGFSAAYDAS